VTLTNEADFFITFRLVYSLPQSKTFWQCQVMVSRCWPDRFRYSRQGPVFTPPRFCTARCPVSSLHSSSQVYVASAQQCREQLPDEMATTIPTLIKTTISQVCVQVTATAVNLQMVRGIASIMADCTVDRSRLYSLPTPIIWPQASQANIGTQISSRLSPSLS
jgi:hypothetical protein